MNTKDIDILNVLLIVTSLVLAFNIPFGLFIFSYAFLGPLHYLTEINWLKQKKYFVQDINWVWVLVALSALLSITLLTKLPFFSELAKDTPIKKVGDFFNHSGDELLLISLLFAIGLIHFRKKLHLILFLMASILIALPALYYSPPLALGVAILVPTLIHVYVFTLLFMIYGTMQSKSTPGIVAIVLLLVVPIVIAMSNLNPGDYADVSDYTRNSFEDSGFGAIIYYFTNVFTPITKASYLSQIGIKIQIFVAFAYTYHYLNWFSKTSIIGWNKNMSKTKARTVISIWLLSVALYLYNFKIGFIVLGFLSLLHVFLEFPLNITSIKGILIRSKRS